MSIKSPECYTIDPQTRCLRIEISATRSLLLPFDQFAFAELVSEDKEQKLRLVFATHEILISGHTLRRIAAAMQRMELSFLTTVPVKYQPLIAENQPKIREIVVTEAKAVGIQSEASLN
ncbi:MAG: hypothetical protein ACLQQ0_12500 [Limisphaerales bacterium]